MNDLEQLKDLLFGAEKQALDSITERVQRRESRAADVADVLPEAVRLSHGQDTELVSALREPVGECLQEEFHREPAKYADALYPVMGPAIRKSIVSALRGFAQQINEAIEQSLSAKGVKWRIEAWRSGVPFGEYVVQRSLLYRIEQAYLISRENGLLIGHAHHQASKIKDSDAVSAMFTAIQDFVKESFSPDRSGRLETADMGEFTLWAVHGPHALLVCVIRGVPPRSLRSNLSAILERVHFRYADAIRQYAGDTSTMVGVEDELSECLRFEAARPADEKQRRSRLPVLIVGLLLVAALTYFGVKYWDKLQELRALEDALADTPGWYVSNVQRQDGVYVVHGLKDPLASEINEVAQAAGLDDVEIIGEVRSFQSLDPAIVFRRAQDALDPPPSISIAAEDDKIVVRGTAAFDWIRKTARKIESGVFQVPVVLDAVTSLERDSLEQNIATIRQTEFSFVDGTTLAETDATRIQEHAANLGQLAADASRIDTRFNVTITGHTDGIGNEDSNRELALRRVAVARTLLLEHGIPDQWIEQSVSIDAGSDAAPNLDKRRVTIELDLLPPAVATTSTTQ